MSTTAAAAAIYLVHLNPMTNAHKSIISRLKKDYTFYSPYSKYMPPLLSSRSWELRNQIITQINEEKFVSYTGDKAEQLMLKAYRLNPLKADRFEVSASSIRARLYRQ